MNPGQRVHLPGDAHWFGTDMYGATPPAGSSTGAGISFVVGLTVAAVTSAIGLGLGVFAGFVRRLYPAPLRVESTEKP